MLRNKYIFSIMFVCLLLAALASPAHAQFMSESAATGFAIMIFAFIVIAYAIVNIPLKIFVFLMFENEKAGKAFWLSMKSLGFALLLNVVVVPLSFIIFYYFWPEDDAFWYFLGAVFVASLVPDYVMYSKKYKWQLLLGANVLSVAALCGIVFLLE